MTLFDFFHYTFAQHALIAGSFIGVSCAILGLFLVLRHMSLIGDGLSHISFGAVAIGILLGISPLFAVLPLVILGSLVILAITRSAKISGDSAIGIISAFGIASGVIITSFSHGFNVGLLSYLFGNILAITRTEVFLSIGLALSVVSVLILFYWDLFSSTFDEEYAKVSGIRPDRINAILAILTAITVALAVKVVGIMLISAMLILPANTALHVSKSFTTTLFLSILFALLSVILGLIFSFLLNTPAGATIVMLNILFFIVAFLSKKLD